jgi:hypothetical protein
MGTAPTPTLQPPQSTVKRHPVQVRATFVRLPRQATRAVLAA